MKLSQLTAALAFPFFLIGLIFTLFGVLFVEIAKLICPEYRNFQDET